MFPEPTFVMYRLTSRAHGWEPVGVPLDDAWGLDAEGMSSAIEQTQPKLVYYATPNNPTGTPESREDLVAILEAGAAQPNGGPASARNRGAGAARGRFEVSGVIDGLAHLQIPERVFGQFRTVNGAHQRGLLALVELQVHGRRSSQVRSSRKPSSNRKLRPHNLQLQQLLLRDLLYAEP